MSHLDTRLVTPELRLAIQALTSEHAWRLDHGSANTLHELYAEDGALLGLPPEDLIGREAIRAWGAARVKLPRVSRHVETNHRLEWRDGVLHGTLYASVYRDEQPDAAHGLGAHTAPLMVGDYLDTYVLQDGRWLIARRAIIRAFRAAR
jgi:hypothetical protein